MAKFKRELLEAVAQQMNSVMGLDPAIDTTMTDDDTLLDTICWEARGRDVVKDAIRADDFVTSNPDKKTFDGVGLKFFADAGIWDEANKYVIMAGKAAAAKPVEKPAKTAGKKATKPAEEATQEDMDAGDAESELPLEQEAEQVGPVVEKAGKRKADKKSAVKTTTAAEPVATEKEEVMKTKTAAKPAAKASKSMATQKKATAEKPVAKKTEPVKTKAAPRGTGVGALCRDLIVKYPDKDNTELAKMVRTKLKTETPSASVAWYRNQMKAGKKAKKK